jgi:hypothetical protein
MFRQRYGLGLEDLVRGGSVLATTDDEQAGRASTLRASLLPGSPKGRAAAPDRPESVVVASGNLGLVYLPLLPGRVTLEEIEKHHPGLVDRLATHPGVGWVMVRSEADGPVVLGAGGRRRLDDDHVDGADPLDGFGPYAAGDLRRHDGLEHTPDILVNSLHDPVTGEVAAFEELVGCHGGLGGWQNRPVLIHPRDWPVAGDLDSADAVHAQLKHWLRSPDTGEVHADRQK